MVESAAVLMDDVEMPLYASCFCGRWRRMTLPCRDRHPDGRWSCGWRCQLHRLPPFKWLILLFAAGGLGGGFGSS